MAGALLAASFPKYGVPTFAWGAIAPLCVAVALRATAPLYTPWTAFRLGLLTGLVYFGATLYWVVDVMTTYGGLGLPIALVAASLLVIYLSLYVGGVAVLLGSAIRRFGLSALWLTPVFWVAAEWARGWIGGGFPWVPLGSSQVQVLPIAQLASVTGVFGLSLLVALVGTAAAVAALSRRRRDLIAVGAVTLLLVVVAGAGAWRLRDSRLNSAGHALRVGLIQGNVEQDIKWNPKFKETIMARYMSLSRDAIARGAQLVVWPEASTPFFLDSDGDQAAPIRALAAETRTPFVIGTDEFDGQHVYNAAAAIGVDGKTRGSYRKIHLVPFGEYVPLKKLLFFVGPLVEAVSDFAPGTEATVLDLGDGLRASVAICYESTYPTLTRAFAESGAQLLLVVTNDGWFGRSSAAFQHFQMGSMRAIETGRYLARAANTGITAVVDPYGRVVAQSEMFQPLGLVAEVRALESRTIYTRIGDLVAWLCAVLTLAVAVVVRRHPIRSY